MAIDKILMFQKEVEKHLQEGVKPEQIPGVVKRCPKCRRLTLQFDPSLNRLFCTHCDFSVMLRG